MRLLLIIVWTFILNAQSNLNPNISLIGDIRLKHEKVNPGKDTDFSFKGVEMVIENYLNPYSKAWTTIHFSDAEKVDIEEAYITIIKGLPLKSQIRFGRYFLPFGEILQKHIHVNSFLDYPTLHQAYFGEEGTRNIGLEVNFAFPILDQFTELKLNVLEGNITPEDHGHDEGHDEDELPHVEEEAHANLAFGVYYSIFTELSDYSNLKSSISYISGGQDQEFEQKTNLIALAFKYKWQPSDYTYFELLSEIFFNERDIHVVPEHDPLSLVDEVHEEKSTITNNGFFLAANYQFNLAHNLGFSYSQYKNPLIQKSDTYKDMSVFTGYAPFEESLLFRIKYMRDLKNGANKMELQVVFSLGPHKAHQF